MFLRQPMFPRLACVQYTARMHRKIALTAVVTLLTLLASCTPAPSAPTGPVGAAPVRALPNFSHIYVLLMENEEEGSVIGSSAAPYINSLARQYAQASQYFGVSHPSLPNYLELLGGSTFGISSDCTDCFVSAPNLADQLDAAHKSWKAYMEDMPSPCFVGNAGYYAQKHDPFIYFNDIRTNPARCANVVPLTRFSSDLAANALPDFVWITPNLCHDMHDCPVSAGNSWLKGFLPQILHAPDWQTSALFLLWDEGTSNAGCCQIARGGHIPMLVISPLVTPGFVSAVPYDHASVLLTIEDAWGLGKLGDAACACTNPLTDFF
jgi:phosphatidylinositol-3-phosphatase